MRYGKGLDVLYLATAEGSGRALRIILIVAVLCFVYSARAATLGTITLQQALSSAIQANPDLMTARASLTQAKASTSEVKKSYLPNFSAEGQYSTSDDVTTLMTALAEILRL